MLNLRPQNFAEFKGQNKIKNNLEVYINAAINNNVQLDHILLYGLPGTGKTSLAFIIANYLNRDLKIIQGTQIKKVCDLINFLSLMSEGDIVFIDEIHAIGEECFETLYSILEDNVIDIKLGKDNNSKYTRVSIPKFTMIGATTDIAKIPKPLEERFGINFFLDLYSNQEIIDIVKQTIEKINLALEHDEISQVASYSKGIPRIANNLVKRIFDYKSLNSKQPVSEILNLMGLYTYGLNDLDLKYLNLLNNNQILGIKTISNLLELDQSTIENKIEPYLIKTTLIIKTSRGRKITNLGKDELKKIMEKKNEN